MPGRVVLDMNSALRQRLRRASKTQKRRSEVESRMNLAGTHRDEAMECGVPDIGITRRLNHLHLVLVRFHSACRSVPPIRAAPVCSRSGQTPIVASEMQRSRGSAGMRLTDPACSPLSLPAPAHSLSLARSLTWSALRGGGGTAAGERAATRRGEDDGAAEDGGRTAGQTADDESGIEAGHSDEHGCGTAGRARNKRTNRRS